MSLDHYTPILHDKERGMELGTDIDGLNWLVKMGFDVSVAGRTCWGESLAEARSGYAFVYDKRPADRSG